MTKRNVKLGVVLTVMLAMSVNGFAQGFSGSGTSTDPYQISTAAELADLATFVNAATSPYADSGVYYKLMDNIDLSDYGATFNDKKGWIPIGEKWSSPFKGNFDGDDKKISNLFIDNVSNSMMGLFGCIRKGSIVANLGVEDVNITGNSWIGGIIGTTETVSVVNCYCTGKISGEDDNIGGVAGFCSGTLNNCYSSCEINGRSNVGGLIGNFKGILSNCHSSCKANGMYCIGGVVGCVYDSSKVSNCYSVCEVSGSGSVGGVVGCAEKSSIVINCYSIGTVIGSYPIGGVVGRVYLNCTVSNCYSISEVNGGVVGLAVGGIVGESFDNCNISNCASLNPSIKGYEEIGRVVGDLYGTPSTLSNNIAWDSVENEIGTTAWSNKGDSRRNGADISKETINADGTLGGRFTTSGGWTTQNGKLPGFGTPITMPEHLRSAGMVYITTETIPDGTVGEAYSVQLAADGDNPISWAILSGNLPTGLALSSAGIISGTPTITGTKTFTVKAENAIGNDQKNLSITIGAVGIVSATLSNQLRIYPNPTNYELRITNHELKEDEVVEIYSVVGQRLMQLPCRDVINHVSTIDVSGLANGMYYLKIGDKTVRFVKE